MEALFNNNASIGVQCQNFQLLTLFALNLYDRDVVQETWRK